MDKAEKHNKPSHGVLTGYLQSIGSKLQPSSNPINDLYLLSGLDKLEQFTQ